MKDKVDFESFSKLDLRVAEVKKVTPLKGSEKLYLLLLDLGEEGERQVVAGLRPYYSPEELEKKKVILVANLEEKQIFGHLSQGMLLAADDGQGKVSLLIPDKDIRVGSRIR